jgi:hypothetical protein
VTQSPDTPYTTTTTATAAATTFNMLSVTRQVHSLFQSAFYTGSELVFHISISLSSCFIKAIRKLLTSSSLPSRHVYFQSIFPSIMCFRRQLLRKMLPFVLLYVCVGYSYPPWLQVILIYFLHDRSNWSTFRSLQLSAPYKAMLQMWHFISSFLKFKLNWLVFFICTCCIIRYQATHIVEIFLILQLLFVFHNLYRLYRRWLPWEHLCLRFDNRHFYSAHILTDITLSNMPCCTSPSAASSTSLSVYFYPAQQWIKRLSLKVIPRDEVE